ncbi:MAG TPA: hypothetical protein VGE15_06905 [Sphingobacteriaceae bacterium]
MNTKLLMSCSALVMGACAVFLSFLPGEILNYLGASGPVSQLALQLLGAVYFGFAMLNWMAKGNLIGGIYSKPVSIGNLAHFTIAGITLIRIARDTPEAPLIWVPAVVCAVFALLFARVSFRHPGETGAAAV